METSEQSNLDLEETKVESADIDIDSLQEVEPERKPLIDLNKYVTKLNVIESIKVDRIPSPYAKAKDGKVHVVRAYGAVVETVKTDKGETISFRPIELIDNMEEDEEGKLLGFPKGEKRKWQRFKKTLRIKKATEAIGKQLPMKVNTNKKNQEFLGYLY